LITRTPKYPSLVPLKACGDMECIVSQDRSIAIEDLKVSGRLKNHKLVSSCMFEMKILYLAS
jgi:hypothetical protein